MEGKQSLPPPMSTAAVLESSKLFCYLDLYPFGIIFSTKHSNVSSVWQNISITVPALFFYPWKQFSSMDELILKCQFIWKAVCLGFFCVWMWSGRRRSGKRGMYMCIFVFLQEMGLGRQNWFLFPIKGGVWREEDCGGKCMEEKYFKSSISKMCIIHGQSM